MKPQREQSRFSLYVFFIIEAFLYSWLLYEFILLRLYIVEDMIRATGWEFLPAAGIVLLNLLYRRELKGRLLAVAVADVALFILMGILMAKLAELETTKTRSFLHLAMEWSKMPANVALMWNAFPLSVSLLWAALAGLLFLLAALRRRFAAAAVAALLAAPIVYLIFIMGANARTAVYLLFVLPLVLASFAALLNLTRMFARLLFMGGNLLTIMLFYIGVFPLFPAALSLPPGTEKLYPPPGERAEFHLRFMREFQLDGSSLFASFGPSSGFVRFDLDTREAHVLESPGLIRTLWTSGDTDELLAIDFVQMELKRVDKERFEVRERVNLFRHGLAAPMDFTVVDGKMFVINSDNPSITRFDLRTMRNEKQINFRDLGITTFRTGAWQLERDERSGRLFVELGHVNARGLFYLLRIDPQDLAYDSYAPLPEGGLELLAIPQKRSVVMASFFSRNLYEIDMDTMKVRRVFQGPLTCRNLAYYPKRDALVASSFTTGELSFIRYEDAETLGTYRIGKKTTALLVAPDEDALYFGSASGIFRTDLKKALAE